MKELARSGITNLCLLSPMGTQRHIFLAGLVHSFGFLLLAMLVASCRPTAHSLTLTLPTRAGNAPEGAAFAKRIESLNFTNREREILAQVFAGNVPGFQKRLVPVTFTNTLNGKSVAVTCFVTPDYLAVGSDADYFLTPMSPMSAQKIADRMNCFLPTRKLSDAIYKAAAVKLAPAPIPPTPAMTTVPVFVKHNETVRAQRAAHLSKHPLGTLVAGDKKDVVICEALHESPGKVAIYGWHQTNGVAIQPLYLKHAATWVDYSHGIRLVSQDILIDGEPANALQVLASPAMATLLSDEGVIHEPRYATEFQTARTNSPPQGHRHRHGAHTEISFPGFQATTNYGEMIRWTTNDLGVRILINTPPFESFATNKPVQLIFYGLPNGNTIEQTVGKKLQPGDDWHFDIQHIGAQTRLLRRLLPDRTIVVAYLEADKKTWPNWRTRNGDQKIPALFDSVKQIFAGFPLEIVLTGHSGGGSLTFGYLNAMEQIPSEVKRIAFLDSNYAYTTTNHLSKLANWLKASPQHFLCVLAYHDSIALLDGKTFVSEKGGTWGRSHAMLADFGEQFRFTNQTNAGLRTHTALDGRLQLLLKENPEKKILHTVQVERNGFIHAMVIGTSNESRGYRYLGDRAYNRFVAD